MSETITEVAVSRAEAQTPGYSLGQLLVYFLRLGGLGFGGPVALVGYMRRDLVEKRGWIAEADYKEGLALAQLAPGPLAAQLIIYLGYVHYRLKGATLVGLAFVMPSFLMVVGLGFLYSLYGGLDWMQAVFYGVASAVIGIIAHSAYKLTTKTTGKDWRLWAIFGVTGVVSVQIRNRYLELLNSRKVNTWLSTLLDQALNLLPHIIGIEPAYKVILKDLVIIRSESKCLTLHQRTG